MITIQMKFFGAFRKFGESLALQVPVGTNVAAIKAELQSKLNGESLVSDSVLADDSVILRDDDILEGDAALSILPPVCGG